jgi:hypothetical protein
MTEIWWCLECECSWIVVFEMWNYKWYLNETRNFTCRLWIIMNTQIQVFDTVESYDLNTGNHIQCRDSMHFCMENWFILPTWVNPATLRQTTRTIWDTVIYIYETHKHFSSPTNCCCSYIFIIFLHLNALQYRFCMPMLFAIPFSWGII